MAGKRYLDNAYEPRSGEEMRDYYDRWAEVYDEELTENAYSQPLRCAKALASQLPDMEARILDVGCGTGLSGLALVEAGYRHVDGCDFSQNMLEKAFHTGVYSKLFLADLNEPPLDARDNSYDAVTAVGIFSYGHVDPNALEEFIRVAKPGSPIVIGMNDHFYKEGAVPTKLAELEMEGRLRVLTREHGDHIPGTGLTGWVIVAETV